MANDLEAQLSTLRARHAQLAERRAALDAENASIRAQQREGLISGTSPAETRKRANELRAIDDERSAIAGALEQLDGDITAMSETQVRLAYEHALREATADYDQCIGAVHAARAALSASLREFIAREFPLRLTALQDAQQAGRRAAAHLTERRRVLGHHGDASFTEGHLLETAIENQAAGMIQTYGTADVFQFAS